MTDHVADLLAGAVVAASCAAEDHMARASALISAAEVPMLAAARDQSGKLVLMKSGITMEQLSAEH